ncbi:MAG: HNH endonuclease [Betaproteobacteria bacterium]|nr:HNH endonuclease [Betaproteobacteria bacterium]
MTRQPEPLPEQRPVEKEWSESELEAAVDAYLWMRGQELHGAPYSKAAVNRQLREGVLAGRSEASIEYRMRNISAALEELCLPRIAGYLPAKNVGTGVKDRIRHVLAEKGMFNAEDYAASADEETLAQRVSALRRRTLVGVPRGVETPQRVNGSSSSFARDPLVKAWILQNAKGCCEACDQPAPFWAEDGSPFLEVHHVRPLARGGSDQVSNAVALCPNCHRRCHQSGDREQFTAALYKNVDRLIPE